MGHADGIPQADRAPWDWMCSAMVNVGARELGGAEGQETREREEGGGVAELA